MQTNLASNLSQFKIDTNKIILSTDANTDLNLTNVNLNKNTSKYTLKTPFDDNFEPAIV